MPKVDYRFSILSNTKGQHVLEVEGGDSALEVATCIAEEQDTVATLSYRSAALSRAEQKNRDKVEAMQNSGTVRVLLKSNVKQIDANSVSIALEDSVEEIQNDSVIISAGGILPTAFLRKTGIHVETKWGTE